MLPRSAGSPVTAAIYCRISKDEKGDLLGVRRQERDGRALADRHGWSVGDVLVDDDISAYSGRTRPAYLELLDGLTSGRYGAVVAWHPDRLTRSTRELEDLIDIIEASGAMVATCSAGDLDLTTASGRMTARIVGSVARHESEQKAERIRRKKAELAEAGKPSGGGARAFGYERDGLTIVPSEAAMLEDAARRLLSGEGQASICRGWNEAGMLTGTGSLWRVGTLRNMLLNARIAGLREHRGEVVGEATWPAIVDRATWEQVRAMLTDPSRKQERPARASLLNGLARCGLCGAKLVVAPVNGRPSYRCQKGPGKPGCGGIGIVAGPLEDLITEAVFIRADSDRFATQLASVTTAGRDVADGAASDLAAAEAKLAELAEVWAAGEITRAEWAAARRPLEARMEAARRRLSRRRSSTVLEGLAEPGALRATWPAMATERRRAVLREIVDRIVIAPARRGLNRFDDERVDVLWRDQPAD